MQAPQRVRRLVEWGQRHPYLGDVAFAALVGVVIGATGLGRVGESGAGAGVAAFIGVSIALTATTAWDRRRKRR